MDDGQPSLSRKADSFNKHFSFARFCDETHQLKVKEVVVDCTLCALSGKSSQDLDFAGSHTSCILSKKMMTLKTKRCVLKKIVYGVKLS